MTARSDYRKLVIIGAPRSGTNMLRDVLTALPGWTTWPCDEINFIWRHGNLRFPSDEIPATLARPELAKFVNGHFNRIAGAHRVVVEKTCANSLRVPFVNALVPDAQYIFIRRNGLDVVGSAKLRWTAEADLAYLAAKARFVPARDLPYYASRFLMNRLHRLWSREARVAFWGPTLREMDNLLRAHPLDVVCALQWQACIEKAYETLQTLPAEQWVELSYEAIVRNPARELTSALGALGYKVGTPAIERAVAGVSGSSVGKGAEQLGAERVVALREYIGNTLDRFEY